MGQDRGSNSNEQQQRVAEREEAAEDRPGAVAGGEHQGNQVRVHHFAVNTANSLLSVTSVR
jgi:hypothetical protein